MKRYKDGKMIDTPKEEAEKLQRHFEKHRVANRVPASDYETRIKALEESVAKILSQLNEQKASDEA